MWATYTWGLSDPARDDFRASYFILTVIRQRDWTQERDVGNFTSEKLEWGNGNEMA